MMFLPPPSFRSIAMTILLSLCSTPLPTTAITENSLVAFVSHPASAISSVITRNRHSFRCSPAPQPNQIKTWRRRSSLLRSGKEDDFEDDDGDSASVLPFSESDLNRFSEIRNRYRTIPIMILDAMLPGQCLRFGSADPKFQKMISHALEHESTVGMIGLNPLNRQPLSFGVTVNISDNEEETIKDENLLAISVQGKQRFEIQGDPWMDDSESFYFARVEIVEGREEYLPEMQREKAMELSGKIPGLVEEWLRRVIASGKSDTEGMNSRMRDIGPMPDDDALGARALWLGALINPLPALGVCLEIRPAMLACKNDYERLSLAVTAIQSSIDHLSGSNKD